MKKYSYLDLEKQIKKIPRSFGRLDDAKRYAKRVGRSVYKMYDGKYFVGTYKQAIKRIK